MNKPAAIDGQLVDIRNVSAHKDVVLKISVPAERAQEVIDAFGWPTMAAPIPVAVARMNTNYQQPAQNNQRRRFRDLPPAQQAAMCCNDPVFQQFVIEDADSDHEKTPESAADYVREICNVKSRSDIFPGSDAADKWQKIYDRFDAWRRI